MNMLDLNMVWFFLVGILLTGYALLDGFDLGIGALHLLVKKDEDRRTLLNSIGPVWDGNEVWLITGGGALFAAFPAVYATVFSGFYFAFILLLVALIFRAVAIEFRGKRPGALWRKFWDASFSLGSVLASFVLGVIMGNLAWGVPLSPDGEFAGTFWSLFRPYPLLMGVTAIALFMMHGSIYLTMKTEGELHDRVRGWIKNCVLFFTVCYAAVTFATLFCIPHIADTLPTRPALFLVVLACLLAIANIPREVRRGRDGLAFLSSCLVITALMALFGLKSFPFLLYNLPNPGQSLTAYNAASSQKALGIMLTIALIGMPLVVAYTVGIYWVFRGKVKKVKLDY